MTQPPPIPYATAAALSDPGNPWRAIWTRPRHVVRWALATDPTRLVPELIGGGAVASTIASARLLFAPGGDFPLLIIYLTLGTTLSFLISYHVVPSVLVAVGRRFNGTGNYDELQVAVAYASIPTIWGLLPFAVSLSLLALQSVAGLGGGEATLLLAAAFAEAVIAIWGAVIFVGCVGEAHQLSTGRAILTVASFALLAFAAVLLVLVVLLQARDFLVT